MQLIKEQAIIQFKAIKIIVLALIPIVFVLLLGGCQSLPKSGEWGGANNNEKELAIPAITKSHTDRFLKKDWNLNLKLSLVKSAVANHTNEKKEVYQAQLNWSAQNAKHTLNLSAPLFKQGLQLSTQVFPFYKKGRIAQSSKVELSLQKETNEKDTSKQKQTYRNLDEALREILGVELRWDKAWFWFQGRVSQTSKLISQNDKQVQWLDEEHTITFQHSRPNWVRIEKIADGEKWVLTSRIINQ